MAWYQENKRTWLESLSINVVKSGPVPKHVAFIMDGNRRYATKIGLRKAEGHVLGFEKLSEMLGWCLDLGITEVTIYTFSIENFKRPKDEVDCLMDLAREKFEKLLEEKEKLDKTGVRIRILGDITLLPVDLQKLVAEAVLYTKDNSKAFLNVCLAYTSREEMTSAVKDVADGVVQGMLEVDDVTEELFERSLYSADSSRPDLVVRTSGEIRLSDFLLWQSSFSLLAFLKVLWPEFSIWHLLLAVLYYQHNFKNLKKAEQMGKEDERSQLQSLSESQYQIFLNEKEKVINRQNRFIEDLYEKRLRKLEDMKVGRTVQKTYFDNEINA